MQEIEARKHVDYWASGLVTGVRSFIETDTAAPSVAKGLLGQAFPGIPSVVSGVRPRCYHTPIEFHPMGMPGVALITARYDSRYRKFKREVKKCKLTSMTRSHAVKLLKDLDGNVIEGPWLDTSGQPDGIHEWRLTRGSNVVTESTTEFQIETAYPANAFNAGAVLRIQDTVNFAPYTIIDWGTFPPYTLLCTGFGFVDVLDDLIGINYYLTYNRHGWSLTCESRKGRWTEDVLTTDDGSDGTRKARVWSWVDTDGKKTAVQSDQGNNMPQPQEKGLRRIREVGDFSAIQGLVYWT